MSPTEIRGIRRGLGLSQSQLAAYLGIANARTVQRWESGDVLITGPAARCLEYMALHGLTRLSTVTDADVERCAEAMFNRRYHPLAWSDADFEADAKQDYREEARTILTAYLGG